MSIFYYIILFLILLELFNSQNDYENNCKGNASTYEDCYNLIKNDNKPYNSYCCFINGELNDLKISECQILYSEEYNNLEKVKDNFKNIGFSEISINCDYDRLDNNDLNLLDDCYYENPSNKYECFEKTTSYDKEKGYECCYIQFEFKDYKDYGINDKFCILLDKEMQKLYKDEIKTLEKEFNIKYTLKCGDEYYFHNISYYLFYIILIINIIN